MPEQKKQIAGDPLRNIYWRDELLQLMYWMAGEGLGKEFTIPELQKFLQKEDEVLVGSLEEMVSDRLIERTGENRYTLTASGQTEGGRRFAEEFESMIKPGHFECDEPDCDCHSVEGMVETCKHLSSAHTN